jgi:hypothetical protein
LAPRACNGRPAIGASTPDYFKFQIVFFLVACFISITFDCSIGLFGVHKFLHNALKVLNLRRDRQTYPAVGPSISGHVGARISDLSGSIEQARQSAEVVRLHRRRQCRNGRLRTLAPGSPIQRQPRIVFAFAHLILSAAKYRHAL